jgi:hypothetical protein
MTDFDSATHGALGKGKLEPRQVVVRGKTQVISRSGELNAGMRKAERGIRNLQATWRGPWPVLGNSPAYSLNIPHSVFPVPHSLFQRIVKSAIADFQLDLNLERSVRCCRIALGDLVTAAHIGRARDRTS